MNNFEITPFFSAGAVADDILYFSDHGMNALFSMDLESGIVRYIKAFPDEEASVSLQHKQALMHKGNIVFVPDQGNTVHILDTNTKDIRTIKIKKQDESKYALCDSLIREDKLWIFPGSPKQTIIAVNLSDGSVAEYDFKLPEGLLKLNIILLSWTLCSHGDDVYMAVMRTSKVIKYNLSGHVIEMIDTGIDRLDSIHKAMGAIWLSTSDGRLFHWDPIENEAQEYNIAHEAGKQQEPYMVFDYHDAVWAVPCTGGMVYKADASEHSFKKYAASLILPKSVRGVRGNVYHKHALTSKGLLFFSLYNRKPALFSEDGVKELPYVLEDKGQYARRRKQAAKKLIEQKVVIEKENLPLLLYVDAIEKQRN